VHVKPNRPLTRPPSAAERAGPVKNRGNMSDKSRSHSEGAPLPDQPKNPAALAVVVVSCPLTRVRLKCPAGRRRTVDIARKSLVKDLLPSSIREKPGFDPR